MNRVVAAISILMFGGAALAGEQAAVPSTSEVAFKCQEIIAGEALSEADRKLYFEACVAELTAYSERNGESSI